MGSKKKQKSSRKADDGSTHAPRAGKGSSKSGKKSHAKSGERPAGKRAEKARGVALAEQPAVDAVPTITTVDVGVRELQVRLEVVQQQFVGVVSALDESTARLQAAVALIADLPTSDAATDSGRELRQRLEQMLVAQQRTNELLDLALGVAVAPDVSRHSV
jgi:hypothetical protein